MFQTGTENIAMLATIVFCLLIYQTTARPQYPDQLADDNLVRNVRVSLGQDDQQLLGTINFLILENQGDDAILRRLKNCLRDQCPSDNRLRSLINIAREGSRGESLQLTSTNAPAYSVLSPDHMRQRVQRATLFLERYERDNSILGRIIAIDEMWVTFGRLSLIAAYHNNQIIAYRFIEDHALRGSNYASFVREELATAIAGLNIVSPIIIVDNAQAHFDAGASLSFSNQRAEVWFNPPRSPDMMPLDIDGFDCIVKKLKEVCFQDMDQMKHAAIQAINEVNSDNCLHAIQNLPDTWRGVIAAEGHPLKLRRSRHRRSFFAVHTVLTAQKAMRNYVEVLKTCTAIANVTCIEPYLRRDDLMIELSISPQ